jgi:hypothetical protein
MPEASAAKSKAKPKASRASARQPAVEELQRDHAAAQAEYAKAMSDGLARLNQRSVEAQVELAQAVRELAGEMLDGEQQASSSFPERVKAAIEDPDVRERAEQSYQAYADAARAVLEARAEAQQRAADAYQSFAAAVQLGGAEDEVRRLGEEAREAYLAALRAAGPGDDLTRAAQEAAAACERTLGETRREVLEKVAAAVGDRAGSRDKLVEERDIGQRYQDAVQRYYETVSGVSEGTRRTLLEAEIRALRELQAGWSVIADAGEEAPAAS